MHSPSPTSIPLVLADIEASNDANQRESYIRHPPASLWYSTATPVIAVKLKAMCRESRVRDLGTDPVKVPSETLKVPLGYANADITRFYELREAVERVAKANSGKNPAASLIRVADIQQTSVPGH